MSLDIESALGPFFQKHPGRREPAEAALGQAARLLSPQGLERLLEGARALAALGRGPDLVMTWLETMPDVARECGEDALDDCLGAALKLSSMTSGEVIALLIASLPTAARRLGDVDLLRGYLTLVHQLSARAARGLRPMLGIVDTLLDKLTLSGLKGWTTFGIEAHRRDPDTLVQYFALKTQDSQAMFQQQRRGTLFVDTHRRMNFYLRALWGRDFFLRPTAADHEGFKPTIDGSVLHLPDAVDGVAGLSGLELYRAMAAHMAAHITATTAPMPAEDLTPAQKAFVGLVEDARVEHRAIAAFPGLREPWRRLLAMPHTQPVEHRTVEVLEQVALMLLDPSQRLGDPALETVVDRFHSGIASNLDNPLFARDLGLELFAALEVRKEVPSLRILESLRIPYRDDNRFIWTFDPMAGQEGDGYIPASLRQVRKTVSVMEMVNELDCELAGDDAQEIWRLETPFFLDQEGCTINELEGKEPISAPFHYHEWDHQVQLFRPDWTTVTERRQPRGPAATIDAILDEHRPIVRRIRQIVDRLQPQGVQRHRNLEDGDEIDLTAAIDAMVDIRMGRQPNPRITMRNVIKRRDLAVVLLLDLSESTNEVVPGSDMTILDLTRAATTLVATAIAGIGDPFAIHGFASDSRHDVQYYRFKDFGQSLDQTARERLAGMRGGLSTRMGAALRHAAAHLARRPERRKLVLLLTDGEPADIDERDPQHLRRDTKKAVEELAAGGILTYCLTLDPHADAYVQRLFGPAHYTVVDDVRRLPETLPTLFASLTG